LEREKEKKRISDELKSRAKKHTGKTELTSPEMRDINTIAEALSTGDQVFADALSEKLRTDTMQQFILKTDSRGAVENLLGLFEGTEADEPFISGTTTDRVYATDVSLETAKMYTGATPMSVDKALEQAAIRHLVANYFDTETSKRVSRADIEQDMRLRKDNSKWASKIKSYTDLVKKEMGQDLMGPHWEGAGTAADPIKVAWIKANLWLEEDGDQYRYGTDDLSANLIEQLRDPSRFGEQTIAVPGVDPDNPMTINNVFHGVADKIKTALETDKRFFGAGVTAMQDMQTTNLKRDHIQRQLERKALAAGADLTQAHIQEWINVTTDDIYLDALGALGEPDDFGMMQEDQTASWVKMNERLVGLGELTPEELSAEGLKLMGEGDKNRWFGAFIRQDPAMQELFPTELDRELLAVGGFNAMRTKWIESGTDEDFTVWVTNNIAAEASDVLQTQKAVEGGLNTEPGRKKRFYDMARSSEWAGDKIFPENPTAFEQRTMRRVRSEAEQEFIDGGSIPGTFEEIVADKFSNWGEAVRKSGAMDRQQMGQLPPGFRPEMALAEGLSRLEQRIGGPNLQGQITENEARVVTLQQNLDRLRDIERYDSNDQVDLLGEVEQAQTLLNAAKKQGSIYKQQLAERTKETSLRERLRGDDQLAQAFASGNRSSLRSAADARDIPPDEINDLVDMQARSGIADTGAVQVATPEMLAEENRQQEIRAAQMAARTVRFDAEGNPIPPDPAEDSYNIRTQVRTDPDGNVIPPNPDAMIPGTQLPDTQENRDAVGQGLALPGQRQGEGFERDDDGQVVRDKDGNPVPLPGLPVDYEPPELILGARREVPPPPPTVVEPAPIPGEQAPPAVEPAPTPGIPAREPDIGTVGEFIPTDTDIVVPPPPVPPPPEPEIPEPQTPEPRRGREAWLAGSRPEAPIPEEEDEEERKRRNSRQLE